MQKPDSLIFDMDGTLWDAVDTYTETWNETLRQKGINKKVDRDQLASMVGWEGKKVVATLLPEFNDEERQDIYSSVVEMRHRLLPELGGKLYEGVKEGLAQLATQYQLFILSNCGKGIIKVFIDWAGINEYITDEMAYGVNLMPKNHNIKLLTEKHQLKNPVYIGDTEGDGAQSRLANVPFVFVSYGFGQTEDYDLKFDDFRSFTDYFMKLS